MTGPFGRMPGNFFVLAHKNVQYTKDRNEYGIVKRVIKRIKANKNGLKLIKYVILYKIRSVKEESERIWVMKYWLRLLLAF